MSFSSQRSKERVIVQYGNVQLERAMCPNCRQLSFLRNGETICCLREIRKPLTGFEQGSEPSKQKGRKRRPSPTAQAIILNRQGNRCLYCHQCFGSEQIRYGRIIVLRVNWDHIIPYAYTMNSKASNFAAACQVCNALKASKVFKDIDSVRLYLEVERERNGYRF